MADVENMWPADFSADGEEVHREVVHFVYGVLFVFLHTQIIIK